MSFGYASEEFEVTQECLGCYRPEEHIDNPKGYADGLDARTFDPRLHGPVDEVETEIDMRTGMKNYISNEPGHWVTSAGYLRYSFARSIHFGRLYTSGAQSKGKDDDLCEALRCLGQGLHCMEDFGAHSNYCELALRELGYHYVFPHCGAQAEINVHGRRLYPIVTGTVGAVDFLHSVIGEANDHFTQSEVDEVDVALKNAKGSGTTTGSRGLFDGSGPSDFVSLLSRLPNVGNDFADQARGLQAASEAQEQENQFRGRTEENVNLVPDKIVKAINRGIAEIPSLEKLIEHISETLTAFVLGLFAPFIRPIINQVSKVFKDGSSGVITASSKSQLESWDNPRCSDPTHSMLFKDHFTNVINSCAGRVATTTLQYAVPRILFAWENPNVQVDEVVNDVLRAFHHPALRDERVEIQRDMFKTVQRWADEHPRRHQLDQLLSSESVRHGKNHILEQTKGGGAHSHGSWDALSQLGHGKVAGSLWSQVRTRDLNSMEGRDGDATMNYMSSSPAPQASQRPTPPGYGHGEAASYYVQGGGGSGSVPAGPPAGYGDPPPQPNPYYSGGYEPPVPSAAQPPYGSAMPPGDQWGGQWGGPTPSPGYAGPSYDATQPHYAQHLEGQPPSWNSYPGQHHY